MNSTYDVAIIGGGPAGSTAATFLARKGRRTLVIERERFPRFHVGESLLPYSMDTFQRLGVLDRIEERFLRKFGGEILTSCGTRGVSFRFSNALKKNSPFAYQVRRSEFDEILLDNARENGAEVAEETAVQKVEFDDKGAMLSLRPANGTMHEIEARYVLDCSGRNAMIGCQHGLRRKIPHLQKFSVYAHYAGLPLVGEDNRSLIRLIRGATAWYWYIPLSDELTSVGLVLDTEEYRRVGRSPEDTLASYLAAEPATRAFMGDAPERVSPVYATGDYSYSLDRLTGDRWMVAGDAAGFIDPIFSTGVFLAIYSAEQCAEAIDATLADPSRRTTLFAQYERKIRRVMRKYQRFVDAWYSHEFIEVFTTPTVHLDIVPAVNSILAGNVEPGFGVWWRLQLFYLVVYLQKFIPLVPRLTLTPPLLKTS